MIDLPTERDIATVVMVGCAIALLVMVALLF